MTSFELIINAPSNQIAFEILGFPIRYYGLIVTAALVVGYFLISRFLYRFHGFADSDIFVNYSVYLVIFSLVGARLFYVLGSINFYLMNPLEIIMINHGGISIWGGIIFGIAALFYFSKKRRFSFFRHASIISIFMPLCQAIGRWGNYFNQEAFGAPSNGLIKLFVDRQFRPKRYADISYYHPAFLYESILDLIIFFVLYKTYSKENESKTFFMYLTFYSIVRLIVESIRIDSVLNISNVHIATIISLIGLIVGIVGLIFSLRKPQKGA